MSTTPSRPAHSCLLSRFGVIVRVLFAILAGSLIAASSAMAQSRGELLYTTHCIACHTTEMHWRDKRVASDWAGLKVQVRRWQNAASLAWSDGDILDVARYLNDSIYHFEQYQLERALHHTVTDARDADLAPVLRYLLSP